MHEQRSHPQRDACVRIGFGRKERRLGESALRLLANLLVVADHGRQVEPARDGPGGSRFPQPIATTVAVSSIASREMAVIMS